MADKCETFTEWVVEPCNADGDIIDPAFVLRERDTAREVAAAWSLEPAYIDVARVTRYGHFETGEVDREYDYMTRHWPDGRIERHPERVDD